MPLLLLDYSGRTFIASSDNEIKVAIFSDLSLSRRRFRHSKLSTFSLDVARSRSLSWLDRLEQLHLDCFFFGVEADAVWRIYTKYVATLASLCSIRSLSHSLHSYDGERPNGRRRSCSLAAPSQVATAQFAPSCAPKRERRTYERAGRRGKIPPRLGPGRLLLDVGRFSRIY